MHDCRMSRSPFHKDAHPGDAQQRCSLTPGARGCRAPQHMGGMGRRQSSSLHSRPHCQAHLHGQNICLKVWIQMTGTPPM